VADSDNFSSSIYVSFLVWSLILDFFNQILKWPSNFNIYAIKPLIWPNQLLKIIFWPLNFNFFKLICSIWFDSLSLSYFTCLGCIYCYRISDTDFIPASHIIIFLHTKKKYFQYTISHFTISRWERMRMLKIKIYFQL